MGNSSASSRLHFGTRTRKWVAATAAGALVAGGLVVAGIGAQQAFATESMPEVEATIAAPPYIAGEDVAVNISIASDTKIVGDGKKDQYNVSFGVTLSADVHVVDTGSLGTAKTYAAGTVLAGVYSNAAANPRFDCAVLGLENVPAPSKACKVPAGKQYLVFQNTSDLPEAAATSHTLTLRPKAKTFPVGSTLDLNVAGFTSDNERYIPAFPGTVSSAPDTNHTSKPGVSTPKIKVNALRVEKSEPSEESELLRGVHKHTTTYTIRVYHTAEGAVPNAQVVDYIPAGLEYLGLGKTDNTTNANGNRGGGVNSVEYDGAARLDATPIPDGDNKAWPVGGETVETVLATVDSTGEMVEGSGEVYTKVTWDMGTLLANDVVRDTVAGLTQGYTDKAGKAGYFELHYRAAVTLFENTMEFGYDAAGKHTANLDNNRGASTRHGDVTGATGNDGKPNSYTNRAYASGTYGIEPVSAFDTETIDAVDVRVLKSVVVEGSDADTGNEFVQGKHARYTLDIATGEYAYVEMPNEGNGSDSVKRPYRVVDDLGDGMCPIFPVGTTVTKGASPVEGVPNLIKGNPNPASGSVVTENMSISDWNALLGEFGVERDCGFTSAGADGADVLVGATLTGIGFDPGTGHFFTDFALDAGGTGKLGKPSETHLVGYSTLLNSGYSAGKGANGATSSGDSVENEVEIFALTHSIDALNGVTSAGGAEAFGDYDAWDDSHATLKAEYTNIEKTVLVREAGVPTATNIFKVGNPGPAENQWVKKSPTPFALGDQIWYRVKITPPTGTDVRNPKFTDFLPAGVEIDPDYSKSVVVKPASLKKLGKCDFNSEADWLAEYVGDPKQEGSSLTWTLGSAECVEGDTKDRFMPLNNSLTFYIKVTVTDQAAFNEVDLPENMAKYQQNNVKGDIFFLRDAAETVSDRTAKLVKGITSIKANDDTSNSARPAKKQTSGDGESFNSDRDGIEVVQGEEVTYRLDITAPYTDTQNYVVWDVLPKGIKTADVKTAAFTASLVEGGVEVMSPVTFTPQGFDHPYTGAPAVVEQLRDKFKDDKRSIIVWTVGSTIPASSKAVPAGTDADGGAIAAIPAIERGVTLGYTLKIPASGDDQALLTQSYDNDASIVEYGVANSQAGQTSTVIVDGTENIAKPRTPKQNESAYVFDDAANEVSDDSNVYLPAIGFTKRLVSTEVGPTDDVVPAGLNDLDRNNGNGQITQGEYATFDYTITIPAHTSVKGGQLSDKPILTRGKTTVPYEYVAKSAKYTFTQDGSNGQGTPIPVVCSTVTPVPATDFECIDQLKVNDIVVKNGVLNFPEIYQNNTAFSQQFAVQITMWVKDKDATTNTGYDPNLGN